MGVLSKGHTFSNNEQVTADKLNNLVDNAEATSEFLEAIYPIGSIYMNATNSGNPGTSGYFVNGVSFGTWAKFAEGRMPIGHDAGDSDFDTAEETGGSKTHTLTVSEIPAHKHRVNTRDSSSGQVEGTIGQGDQGKPDTGFTGTPVESVGGGEAHNNMPPYVTVYMWKRTA